MVRQAGLTLLLAMSACTATDVFTCQTDDQCLDGPQAGLCQPEGYCSFPDGTCDTDQRFGDHAGPLAGECVPAAGTADTQDPPTGDGSVTSDGGMTSTTATTEVPPDPITDTGTSMPPLDTGADEDTGVEPPDQEYGPCVASCANPCFIDETMQYGVCAEGCRNGEECMPLSVDGMRYDLICSADVGAQPGVCLVLCTKLQDCPLGGECVSSLGSGVGVCMWPLGAL